MKRLGLLFGLLSAALLSSAHAASIWTDSEAEIDERVADTQTLAPVDFLKAQTAQIPFTNFRYPHVDRDMDVTFIADDHLFDGSKGKHHGVYRSLGKTGELTPLIRDGEPIPGLGSARFRYLRGLQVDGADFVINNYDSEGHSGLYHYHNGTITLIVRSRETVVPGMDKPFNDVRWGALSNGRVVYMAMAGETEALVLHDLRTKQDHLLIKSGMPIPGQPGKYFGHIGHQNWLDANNIIFRAAPMVEGKPNESLDDTLLYAWFGIDWAHPEKSLSPSRLTALVNDNTSIPLLLGHEHFTDIRSAPVRDGLIGFQASGNAASGIYYTEVGAKAGVIKPIVDTETRLKGLFDGSFDHFSIWSTTFKNSVVFVGYANGYAGVFLYRTDKDELYLLTDNRQPVEGKKVRSFEIAGDFLVGNRFAVSAHFTDGTYGVYLASIPAHSFKRISSPDVAAK